MYHPRYSKNAGYLESPPLRILGMPLRYNPGCLLCVTATTPQSDAKLTLSAAKFLILKFPWRFSVSSLRVSAVKPASPPSSFRFLCFDLPKNPFFTQHWYCGTLEINPYDL